MLLLEITRDGEPRHVELPDDEELLTQRAAAKLLGSVSVSYLRASDCPKVLLPPSRGTRPLVRYRKSAVLAWALHYEVAPKWLGEKLYRKVA